MLYVTAGAAAVAFAYGVGASTPGAVSRYLERKRLEEAQLAERARTEERGGRELA